MRVLILCTGNSARSQMPQQIHWGYPDPAAVEGSKEERLRAFRGVRDGLRQKFQSFLASHRDG